MALTYNTTKTNPTHIYRTTGGGTTFSANLANTGTFDFFTNTFAVNDAFYVGKSAGAWYVWSDIDFNIGTALAGVGVTGVWEYPKGNSKIWTPLERFEDDTNGFTVTGKKSLKFAHQDTWNSSKTNGVTASWVRYRITGFTSRTNGGSNTTDKLLIGDGVVSVDDFTDASPCTLKMIHEYMLINYPYTKPVNVGNYFDMRWFAVDMKSPTVSYDEFLEIGTDMQGYCNLRNHWRFDYWTTGYQIGDNHGRGGSKIYINAITNSYPFYWTVNQKSYGATYFSVKRNAGYPNLAGTFYDCTFQLASGAPLDGDCQNCTFELGFGFIASTWADTSKNPFANNKFLVLSTSAWSAYSKSFDIMKPDITFGPGTKYLIGSQQNNVGGLVWNFIDPIVPLPTLSTENKPLYSAGSVETNLINVFFYNASTDTYTDYSTAASNETADDVPLNGDVGDCLYFNILTAATALQHPSFTITSSPNDYEYVWEYYKSGAWIEFSRQWDETLNLSQSGSVWFERQVSDITITSVNGVSGYYYRLRITKKGTTTNTATTIKRRTRPGTADWNLNYKYSVNYIAKDGSGNPLEGVEVAIYDKNNELQFSGTTDVNGKIPEGLLTTNKYYFDPLDPDRLPVHDTAEKLYNPFNFRSRKYGYMARDISTTVDAPQKPVNVFTPNPNVVADQETAHAYTGIAVSASNNTVTITEDHTMQEVYDYCEDWYSLTPNMMKNEPFETADGQTYFSDYDLVLDGCMLSGNATISMVVNSVTYLNGATSEVRIVAIDGTHTNIKLTGLTSGSRVQLYDTTELYNEIVADTTLTYPIIWTEDKPIRIRVMYMQGATAKKWYETTATLTATGINLAVNQEDDTVYNEIAIDGSTVEECSIDGTNLIIDIDDDDAHTSGQRIYAFEVYWLFTENGIRDQALYINAIDSTRFELEGGLKIKNVSANPLTIDNCNIYPSEGLATDVFDLTGNTIFLNSKIVVPFAYNVNGATEAQFEELIGKTNILDRKVDDTQTRVITLTE